MRKSAMPKALLALSLAIGMTGCGGSSTINEEDIVDAQTLYGCSVINVYNAGEYIGEDTISNFETLFTARVNYDVFDSNETMYTKLLGGSQYDVLIPSDYMIERLISEDLLQPLDLDAIPNLANLSSYAKETQKQFDPDQIYSAPYFYGSVGLVYNMETVDEEVIREQGWDILHNPDYKGRIYAYDSQRDMFMVAFKALGYSMNTDDAEEIQEAYQWLMDMNEIVEPAYVTDEVIDEMVNGNMDIAIMYSGDAAYVISENSDMAYLEPPQGTNVWEDAMVIPANSTCTGLANAFINYMLDNDVAYENSAYVGYTSPNEEVRDELSGEMGDFFQNEAYLPREGYELDESFHYNAALTKQLGDLYTKVKMSVY